VIEPTIDNVRPIAESFTAEERALLATPELWGDAGDRVARGMAFLDRVMPGWETEVEVNKLNLSSGCRCVLGQIFHRVANELDTYSEYRGSFEGYGFTDEKLGENLTRRGFDLDILALRVSRNDGFGLGLAVLLPEDAREVGESPRGAIMLGFDTGSYEDEIDPPSYSALSRAWKTAITKRTGVNDQH
jgi:hypothetical protein